MIVKIIRNISFSFTALIPGLLVSFCTYFYLSDWFYRGLDGSYYFVLMRELGSAAKSLFGLDLDHLQGCSSLQFPVNFRLSLTFLLAQFLPFSPKTSVYLASLALLAFGALCISKILGLNRQETAVFFCLTCVALLPIPFGFYGLAGCAPMYPEVAILSSVSGVLLLGEKTQDKPVLVTLANFILFYLGLSYPPLLVFLFPYLLLLGLNFLKQVSRAVATKRNNESALTRPHPVIAAQCLWVPVWLVLVFWVVGHLGYSAFSFFKEEMLEILSEGDISFLFWGPRGVSALILMVFAWFFSLKTIFGKSRNEDFSKRLSFFLLAFVCLQIVVLLSVVLGIKFPRGFALVYIEYLFYPLMFLVVILGIRQTFSRLMLKTKNQPKVWKGVLGAAAVAAVFLAWGFYQHLPDPKNSPGVDYFDQPKSNPIVEEIRRRNGVVTSGEVFSGRTEPFLGIGFPRELGYDWGEFHAFQGLCLDVWKNDFRTTGLWNFGIPTLFQYSPLRDPFLHSVSRKLLSEPGESSRKNVPVHTIPFSPFLGLLGVRFVISDRPLNDPNLTLLQLLSFPQDKKQARHDWWPKKKENNPWNAIEGLFLYKNLRVHLGIQTPVLKQVQPSYAGVILREMSSSGFFEANLPVAVHSEGGLGPMVPCNEAEVRYTPNGFWIQAKAAGPSCLLLPMTFSHCLEFKPKKGGLNESKVRLIRANLAQTLIVFDREIAGEIRYFSSPFYNPLAVWKDVLDAKKFFGRDIPH